jgi:hypothetical protein
LVSNRSDPGDLAIWTADIAPLAIASDSNRWRQETVNAFGYNGFLSVCEARHGVAARV